MAKSTTTELSVPKTDITVYEKIADPEKVALAMGTAIAKSGLFGCPNIESGIVLAWECLARRRTPLSLAEDYNIIKNTLSMKYDAMLTKFRERGGKHKIIANTSEEAEIELTDWDGNKLVERYTWKEAQQEDIWKTNDKGEKIALKHNWSTPRKRRQMLWARVVSEGVKRLAPEVVKGKYTPEEIEDFDEPEAAPVKKPTLEEVMKLASEPEEAGEIVDAEFTVEQPAEEEGGSSTQEQREAIRGLFEALQVNDEQRAKALAKRGATAIRQLSYEHAQSLLEGLESRAAKLNEARAQGDSRLPNDATSADVTAPVEQSLIDEIRGLMKQNGQAAVTFSKYMETCGVAKLNQLNHEQAVLLREHLIANTMDDYFAKNPLMGYQPS